tara:strand:+ start:56202 stop:60275 length:4074 start_codon:yes stop_codon:yes gene_type:complete
MKTIHKLFVISLYFFFVIVLAPYVNGQNTTPRIKYYTLEDGLSQVSSNDFLLDRSGFIWIATQDGLNRFDGNTFEHFKYNKKDSLSLSGNLINKLLEDSSGNIWVGTLGNGLNYYDPDLEIFHRIKLRDSLNESEIISALAQDKQHAIWVGSRRTGLYKLTFLKDDTLLRENFLKDKAISSILIDQMNMLWVGDIHGNIYHLDPKAPIIENPSLILHVQGNVQVFYKTKNQLLIGTDFGLYRYDIITKKIQLIELSTANELPTKHVLAFLKNDEYSLWVGTGNGIYLFDWVHQKILKKILYSEEEKNGLSNGTVQALLKISENQILVGTANYPNLIELEESYFKNISKNLKGAHLLNDNVIFSIHKEGNDLWIGTSDGGINLIRQDKTYYFNYNKNNPNGISGTVVRAIVKDSINNRLWFGTTRGLNMINLTTFDPNNPKFFVLQHDPNNPNSINGDFLKDLVFDQNNILWGATYGHGIFRLEFHNQKDYNIVRYKNNPKNKNSLHNDFTDCIQVDQDNTVWIGSQSGLSKLSFTTKDYKNPVFKNFSKNEHDKNSLVHNSVYDILIDKKERIWLGTRSGFSQYLGDGKFKSWTQQKQFSNDVVYSIQNDNDGNLWMGTNDGLVRFDPERNTFTQFGISDGIQSKEFDIHARLKDKDGKIYMGGIGGVTYFQPEDLKEIDKPQPLYFSELQVKGNIIKISNDSKSILKQPLKNTENLEFKHNEFPFFLQFSSIDYRTNKNVEYAYKLLPTDSEWNFLKEPEIQFLNLPSGKYTLQINGFSRGVEWAQEPLLMNLVILPPIWTTWWAYLIYLGLTITIAYRFYRFQLSKKLAVSESARLKEVNHLKNSLYDNITHEFRTPLTVILGMTDALHGELKTNSTPPMNNALEMIRRNGNHLLSLVNEMLNLSKLENGHLETNMKQINVVPFIKYLGESFQSFAQEDDIHFTVYSELDELMMDVDINKLSTIVSNLLSNAIKFTPPLGKIVLHIHRDTSNHLILKVNDTGMGISKEELPHIFNRFYQADAATTRKRDGTGIGLALTKELVHLLKGEISVLSTPDQGSMFKIILPITHNAPVVNNTSLALTKQINPSKALFEFSENSWAQKNEEIPLVLIIEDNKDVAYYLNQCLYGQYKTIHGINGILGLEMAFEYIPDVIISDVMMPGKDGFEVCRILKEDERTDHIPIILLTAKVTVKDRLIGLTQGADAYLAKPFVKEELCARVEQLLTLRKKLMLKFQEGQVSKIIAKQPKNAETTFIAKVIALIHEELDNSSFGTSELSFKLRLSESQVYRKLKVITGKSTAVFIRTVRLEAAKEHLQHTDKTVSEIAYAVGFNDPSWFSRAFKEEFGYPPSSINNQH